MSSRRKKTVVQKRCVVCDKLFTYDNPRAKTCTPRCRKEKWRRAHDPKRARAAARSYDRDRVHALKQVLGRNAVAKKGRK